jgi:predicted acetyltransferase
MEIRAVRSEELDAMLALMCEAFSLPYTPARELFYRDPYFDSAKKRVLVEDGQIISCLTIIDATLWLGQAPVRVGGVAGVATRPDHRRRGYAARLLAATLPVLAEQGYGFSALFPYSYDYYRRLGWERAGTHYRLTFAPAVLPAFADARHVRAALPSDRADVARLYETRSRHRTGHWLRDEKRWNYLFEHVRSKAVYKRGALEGYVFYEMRELPEGRRQLHLMELVAATEEARRGLAGFLAQPSDAQEIEWTAGWEDLRDSGLLHGCELTGARGGPRVEAVPGAMFRITDFGRCLDALRPNWKDFRGAVALVLHDERAPADSHRAMTVEGDGAETVVRPGTAGAGPRRRIEGDVRVWSQVLTGCLSLRDALALNRLRAFSETAAALAAPLFPRRDLSIPIADHF